MHGADNTMHASLAAVLIARNRAAEPAAGSSARASMAKGLLLSLLSPGVLMSLRVLILEGRDLLDEQGFAILGQVCACMLIQKTSAERVFAMPRS